MKTNELEIESFVVITSKNERCIWSVFNLRRALLDADDYKHDLADVPLYAQLRWPNSLELRQWPNRAVCCKWPENSIAFSLNEWTSFRESESIRQWLLIGELA